MIKTTQNTKVATTFNSSIAPYYRRGIGDISFVAVWDRELSEAEMVDDTISMDSLSELFYGDREASYKGDRFKIGLPTAMSLQADLYIKRNIYLNAFWLQPVKTSKYYLHRASIVAVTPRYETPWFEASLPVSVYDYRYMRIGLSLRFWFLTIGTERLGTYLGMADINGMDFYASLKFNFVKGACKFKGPNKCLNYEFGISEKDRELYRKRR